MDTEDIVGEYYSSDNDDDPLGLTEGINEEEWTSSSN